MASEDFEEVYQWIKNRNENNHIDPYDWNHSIAATLIELTKEIKKVRENLDVIKSTINDQTIKTSS